MMITVAGSETTASTLAALTHHLLSKPTLLTRLKTELKPTMPDPINPPAATSLDTLQFLNALVLEPLRLHPGAVHRQDRTAPDKTLVYTTPENSRSYAIPPGTAVGMTAALVIIDLTLCESPNEFVLERYLQNPELRRCMLTFSKGTRACVGMNLVVQELMSFTAGIFREYDLYVEGTEQGTTLEMFETGFEDVALARDHVAPAMYLRSKGLRVRIRE